MQGRIRTAKGFVLTSHGENGLVAGTFSRWEAEGYSQHRDGGESQSNGYVRHVGRSCRWLLCAEHWMLSCCTYSQRNCMLE